MKLAARINLVIDEALLERDRPPGCSKHYRDGYKDATKDVCRLIMRSFPKIERKKPE